MTLAILLNLLLIAAGPFAVVGAITAAAMVSWPGLAQRLMQPRPAPRPRPVTRPRPRVTAAWA